MFEDYSVIQITLYALLGLATLIGILYVLFVKSWGNYRKEGQSEGLEMPDSTRQMPEIDEDFEVPEEDQQYLLPITVAVLKQLAFSKRMVPTNAMLIEHLAEALGQAGQSFHGRKNNSERPQKGNEDWLMVAAFAIRLYDEGTPHNSVEARESFVAQSTLATRRLEQWANMINNEIARKVKEGVIGKDDVREVTDHIRTVGATPYTQDEIDDMKKGADDKSEFMRLIKGKGDKK